MLRRSWWLLMMAVGVVLMLEPAISDPQTDLLNFGCSQYNATNLSNFFSSLNATFSELRSQLSNNDHFATAQQVRTSDPVYAMFQCRNYLSAADCLTCFDVADSQIRQSCRAANGARVMFDGCFLRYESNSFYDQTTQEWREVVGGGVTVYGVAQCAQTVSQSGCRDCLRVAHSNIRSCPPEADGRAVDAGCFMRYSDTPFFADNQTTNIAPYLRGDGSIWKKVIIGGVVGGVGLLSIIVALLLWYRHLRNLKATQGGNASGTPELQGPMNYKYKDLKSATKSFGEENKLGGGGFGDVYKGILKNGNTVAVKKLAVSSSRVKADFDSEVKLISNVHHRNLIRLLGCCSKGPELLLVYEYMANGSLDKFLFGERRGALNWKQRFDVIIGTARGLAYLHEQFHVCIIHRDIKSGNILLDNELQPKIADFGLARLLPEDQTHLSTKFAGTLGYTAPEYAIHGQLSEKVDTYAFGVVVLEIISSRKCNEMKQEPVTEYLLEHAWKLYENDMHLKLVDEGLDSNEYKAEDAKKIIEIALMCTQSPVSLRPTMSEVVVLLSSKGSLEHGPLSRPTFVDSDARTDGDTPISTGSSTSNATASTTQSWGWFFSSKETHSTENPPDSSLFSNDAVSEFSMESFNNQKGVKLLQNAETRLNGPNSCWRNAYQNLFAACSEILTVEEKRSRLAWHLSDCFQKDSGRLPFPHCDTKSPMVKCLKNLDEDARRIYLEFYLETNSICHQLQTDAFKRQTEKLINDLKKSAEFAEDKLENIDEITEHISQSSNQIHDSLSLIDLQTQQVAQTSKNVEDLVNSVLKHSEAISEKSKEIAASQSELHAGQEKMKENLDERMVMLHDSYNNLGQEINNLRNETVEIEKEISKVGDAMSSKMKTLESKADDIGNLAGKSLDKQKQLLDGQTVALEGLEIIRKFQSQAIEESRGTLQELAEFGHRQHEELIQRQEQLQRAHDHLVENSKTILEAQEAFESKQASMFIAIDKLFTLHNAMLLESRLIKAFFIYSISICILYMLTSAKQTYTVRPRLYIGLCATFLIEFSILRYATNGIEQQIWIVSLVRTIFVVLASIQLLHAICTYRDYEVLNHQMLLKLMDKVNGMEKNKELLWDMDSDVNWSSWVETELPEGVENIEDPDYILPEEVAENSVATTSITRNYNLRNRRHNF
ncbi:hypothetical protein F0562_004107 [Nyssa sinensis]|uniref:Protein kinase domain-containing protein n=1 Tax=Nyssa sinensis TaxID=561372 RepID=A0A5J5BXN0_9ASTE|nr:hypothetical protein F0562_004107 [Nyssa sinensis]